MQEKLEGSRLPLVGLLVGVWAMLPPYLNPFGKLNVEHRVEITDHIIPGILILAASLLGYLLLRSATPSALLLFMGGGLVALCGFWMVATHVGLINQARQKIVPGGAVIWHSTPGIVVTLFGLAWIIRFWDADEKAETPSGR